MNSKPRGPCEAVKRTERRRASAEEAGKPQSGWRLFLTAKSLNLARDDAISRTRRGGSLLRSHG